MDALNVRALSPAALTDFQVYRAQIAALLDDERFAEWQKPVNGDSAFWSDLQFPARGNVARGAADYRAYLSQLGEMGRYIDEQIAAMRLGLARGFTPPAVVMTGRDKPVAAIADAASAEATVFYAPFAKLPAGADGAALQAAAKRVITASVIPAHRRLLTFLRQTYFPGLRPALDASSYPDGAAYYRSRIRAYTTLDLTPDTVHTLGLAQVAKIRAEMERAKADAGFTGTLPAFLHFLRTDPRFYATTPDQLLKEAAWESKRFDGMASKWFGRLPRSRFAIEPVPPEIAPFYTAGRGGPGTYLVNTYDLPSRPLFQLPALTLHESAPGHAFQIPLAAENTGLPPLTIQRARAKAQAALGASFDIRAFHDTVLSLGSVPMPVLAARIDRFIAEGGPSPYPTE